MKIYKITEASEYLGVSINTLKTLANKDQRRRLRELLAGNSAAEVIQRLEENR